MIRSFIISLLFAACGCGSAAAQVSANGGALPTPLGVTSPLGLGSAPPVGFTGIPLGATELSTSGVSPMPLGITAGTVSSCSGMGSAPPAGLTGNSPSSTLFDGDSTATTGTSSGTCKTNAASNLAQPAASASSPSGMASTAPVGRVGISMGSTELSPAGLSPIPPTGNSPTSTQTPTPSLP